MGRIIPAATIVSYSAIIILLLILNSFLLLNQQSRFVQTQQTQLREESRQIANSLQSLQTTVSEQWYENDNFAQLGEYTRSENLLSYRYELMEELEQRMSFNQHISGFFVFYTGRETWAYVVDPLQIPPEQTERLKALLTAYHTANRPASRGYFLLSPEGGEEYAVIGYTKGNATLYGVYNIGNAIEAIRAALPARSGVFLWDGVSFPSLSENDESLFHRALTFSGTPIVYQQGMDLVVGERIKGTGLQLVARVPLSVQMLFTLQLVVGIVSLLASIVVMVWLLRFLRRHLLLPLRELNQTMDDIRRGGKYQGEETHYSLRELDEVNRTFGYMMQALEKQKVATYEEALEKQKARVQYLQLQLKPHFYLNGLKTVNALALLHNTDRLQEYLQRLSNHMRYLLSLEQEQIELERELQFTRNYVDLQREMTGRKIDYQVFQDRPDPNALVPILCVQTFVENSIKYAKLGNTDESLKIQVDIYHLEDEGAVYLDLTIRDNGPGYPQQVLAQLKKEAIPEGENVGINNIRRRCAILYGNAASFLFENRGGMESEIIFPIRPEKGAEQP